MGRKPALIIFARAPRPGRTKTRLIPALGPERTAELYHRFLADTLAGSRRPDADVTVSVADAEETEAVGAIASGVCPEAKLTVQSGDDLGERMAHAFRESLAQGHPRAALIGTDSPDLPSDRIEHALSLSQTHDVVLGPSVDGGYYLIAMKAVVPGIFDGLAWSSENVLSETLRRARQQGATSALLAPWYDVDTPRDLVALQRRLRAQHVAGEEIPCPRTWEFLRGIELKGNV